MEKREIVLRAWRTRDIAWMIAGMTGIGMFIGVALCCLIVIMQG